MSEDQGNKESYARYLARGSGVTFVGMIILSVGSMAMRVLLARGLSEEFYGLLFSVIALVNIIQTFSFPGFGSAVTRFVSRFNAKEKLSKIRTFLFTSVFTVVILSFSIILALTISSNWLATNYFGSDAAVPVIIILGFWVLMSNLSRFLGSALQGFRDIVGRTSVQITRIWSTVLLILVFSLIADLTLSAAAVLYFLGVVLSSTVGFFFLKRKHFPSLTGKWLFSKSILKKTMKYGFPLFLAGLGGTVISKTDTLMITGLRTLRNVAAYQVARPVSRIVMYLGTAVAAPLFPMISELWGTDKDKTLRTTLTKLLKFSTVGIIPVAAIVLAFPEEIIRILFGARYTGAATPLQILSAAAVFWSFGGIFTSVLSGTDKTMNVLGAMGGAALLNIPANFILIPKYGATGAAIATGISFVFMGVFSFYSVVSEVSFKLPISAVLKTVLGGGLVLLLIQGLKGVLLISIWPKIILLSIASGGLYVIWIMRTKVLTKEDINIFKENVPIPEKILSFLRKIAIG